MRVLDLFSGIGGFSLGLERAGMKTICFVERDAKAQAVLRKHWPDVPIWPDVTTYEGQENEADVVCGGFPCQRFSTAARGRNTADDLWPHMRRIIERVRPVWILAENVPRVDPDYPAGELEAIGYTVWPYIVDASPRGKRHRRKRAIFIAHSNAHGKPRRPVYAKMADMRGSTGRDWTPESTPLGMADGVSRGLDRLQLLGNAFSPVWAEAIGRSIMATIESKEAD